MEMPRRAYAAFMSTADENIGKLIKLLDDLDLREETILIFLSGQGHSYETRTFGGGGSAGPFRGGKTSLFEGGIRVPAIISWPGKIPGGIINSQVTHSIDLLPTIAALCNIDSIHGEVEGLDISSVIINNEKAADRSLYWKLGSQWAVMKDKWKLIGLPGTLRFLRPTSKKTPAGIAIPAAKPCSSETRSLLSKSSRAVI